jgi:hypothetical protein
MQYKPSLLPYTDVAILVINSLILYFVLRMEKINCLPEKDWRPIYLKNYTIANIIITTLSMLVSVNKWNLMIYSLLRLPLHIFLLYVVYTYTRDLESYFMTKCKVLQSDKNVHEYLKFYTLIQACMLLFIITITLTIFVAHFPRYK